MNNSLLPFNTTLVNYNPGKATLLEMRADPKRFPRLKTYDRARAIREMTLIVSQAFLYRGQAADQTNIEFIATSLVDELLADKQYGASNLSLSEIQEVVKRAVLGESEMFGISVASLYKVIIDFVKGEGHRNQKEVAEMKRRADAEALSKSAINPMIQAYAGQFIKNHK